jgi:hypothetical protein
MKYMLSLFFEEGAWADVSPEDMTAEMARWSAFGASLVEAGAFIAGEGLQESATATTVRVGEGEARLVTDGPFAETKEQLGGFYLIECADLDQALEWARKVPLSSGGVEVRPVMDYAALGFEDAAVAGEAAS